MDAKTTRTNWKRSRLKDKPSHVPSTTTTQYASEAVLLLSETVQVAATTSVPPFTIVAKLAKEAIRMAEIVQEYKRNRKKWTSFAMHVQQIVALVIAATLPRDSLEPIEEHLWRMYSVLAEIKDELDHLESRSKFAKFRSFVNEPKMILDYEQRLDRALGLFQLQNVIKTDDSLLKILADARSIVSDLLSVKQTVERLDIQVSRKHAVLRADVQKVHRTQAAMITKVDEALLSMRGDLRPVATVNDLRQLEARLNSIAVSVVFLY